jgi:hypothetical protein
LNSCIAEFWNLSCHDKIILNKSQKMKTTLLFVLAVVFSVSVFAQKFVTKPSANAQTNAMLKIKFAKDEITNLNSDYTPNYNPTVNKSAPGVVETLIGGTVYDNQTNGSVANRIYAFPDGTIAATWIFGNADPNFADRGTGYNYFDGTSWGPEPTARIENARCGWGCYSPLGAGEIVAAHNGSSALLISKRPIRGTGAWTVTQLLGPSVGGSTALLWPRIMASGNTVHIIACTDDGTYQGLSRALVYYRSTDGGTTWVGPTILPGLDAASVGAVANTSFKGFGGDNYAFAAPRGDTVAFVVASAFRGIWVMKSFDNGLTWTKTTVSDIPTFTDITPLIYSNDGCLSMAMDNGGKAHVVFGRMGVSDDTFTDDTYNYRPYMDGLVYWEEGMPILDTTALNNADSLLAHGNLLAYMQDYNDNGVIDFPTVGSGEFPFGLYGASLSSLAQIVIDNDDNMFVSYSQCREDLINTGSFPNTELYRHLYLTSKHQGESAWRDGLDLTDDLEHAFDECVYASLSFSTNNNLHLLVQIDPEPGTAIGSDADPYGDNFMYYLSFPTFVGTKPFDISKDVSVSPNPATDFADVHVMLSNSANVEVYVYDVMGKLVANNNFGQQPTGNHIYKINTSSLTSGVYIFNIQAGGSRTTKKVVVK